MGKVTGISQTDIDHKSQLESQLQTATAKLESLYAAFNKLQARDADTTQLKVDIQTQLDTIKEVNNELQAL